MNLKQRFALYFSILFSTILAVVLIVVFSLFSHYRQEQFKFRLQEKVLSTVKLLVDVKLPNRQMMQVLDHSFLTTCGSSFIFAGIAIDGMLQGITSSRQTGMFQSLRKTPIEAP